MAQRQTDPLAFGEYVSPDWDNSEEVWRARLQVIDAAKYLCPKFLGNLSTKVFPLYSHLVSQGHDFKGLIFSDAPYKKFEEQTAWFPPQKKFAEALAKWASEFNITSAWLLDDALRTLWDWQNTPAWRDSLRWHRLLGTRSRPRGTPRDSPAGHVFWDPFEFRCDGWSPLHVTWPAYRKWLTARLEDSISEYERKMRERAESKGFIRAQRTYSTDNFEWFVRYQLMGQSSVQIAGKRQSRGSDASTVLRGVKRVAALIGWRKLRVQTI